MNDIVSCQLLLDTCKRSWYSSTMIAPASSYRTVPGGIVQEAQELTLRGTFCRKVVNKT